MNVGVFVRGQHTRRNEIFSAVQIVIDVFFCRVVTIEREHRSALISKQQPGESPRKRAAPFENANTLQRKRCFGHGREAFFCPPP